MKVGVEGFKYLNMEIIQIKFAIEKYIDNWR